MAYKLNQKVIFLCKKNLGDKTESVCNGQITKINTRINGDVCYWLNGQHGYADFWESHHIWADTTEHRIFLEESAIEKARHNAAVRLLSEVERTLRFNEKK